MWSNFADDGFGILLFLVWLVLPPLYVVVIGRCYVRQCAESAHEAVWAREELRQALEDLYAAPEPDEPVTVPRARQYCADDTEQFPAAPSGSPGRHRLHAHRSALLAHTARERPREEVMINKSTYRGVSS